jgi:NarL family two-component system response regulator LiaR
VLLVDDHAVVREGLEVLLDGFATVEVVATATGGGHAVEQYVTSRPDVVLMDISMPDIDGVEATRRIVRSDPDARIIALTAFLDHGLVQEVVDAGARGYLLKNVGGRELVDAIHAVAHGGSILSSEALSSLTSRRGESSVGDDLTPRERDILRLLVRGSTNQQIADELGLRHGTIRIAVSNILSKLQVDNRTSAAHVARTHGLVTETT